MMSLRALILKNRSYRRFEQRTAIDHKILEALVDLARLSASSANIQPLKFLLSHTPERNAAIYPTLGWAGYLKDWDGPEEGERPSAYILILGDQRIKRSFGCDHGIAAQSILLGATERGLGGCIIGSIKKKELHQILEIPSHFEILLVLALGVPKEEVQIETVGPEGDIKYWRDEAGVHHVPKRALEELIIG